MTGKVDHLLWPTAARRRREGGFTLIEMLIATIIIIIGLVGVAQLVPTSVMLNANNRNDGTALVLAQKQMEALRAIPLTATTFQDTSGATCPIATTCNVGDPAQPGVVVGSPLALLNNSPIIDFTQSLVPGYGLQFTDPNDPYGAVNDVRWAVVTVTDPNAPTVITGRRIIVGAFRRGMASPTYPISVDTMESK
jgi:type IV pilus assembly protein PilV